MEGYVGEVRMFGGSFAPRSWQTCQGQILPIAQYTALFTLIGTTYGGDGQTTFGLPDLRGRVAIHTGQGAGLSSYVLGQMDGTESVTLTATEVGNHTHSITGSAGILVSSQDGHTPIPVNNFPAINGDMIYSSASDNSQMAPATVSLTANPSSGGSQPISIMKPFLALNFIICLEGIYPTQN